MRWGGGDVRIQQLFLLSQSLLMFSVPFLIKKHSNETQGLFYFIFSYYVEISSVIHYLK